MNHIAANRYRKTPVPIIVPPRVAERAATKYEVDDDGHWISTYSVASHGYAQIGWRAEETGKMTGTTAHRAAWVHYTGEQIPPGVTIDHRKGCPRPCIRKDHLRPLINYENARRTFGRDWPLGECINGHPNSELIIADGGRRIRCRVCLKETRRKYDARRKKLREQ